jgi:hypothetical protein
MTWAPDYVTLPEAKAYLGVTDAVDDVQITGWITAASRAIDKRCNRQFGSLAAPAARTYRRVPYCDPASGLWQVDIDDVQSSTGLTVNGTAYATSGAVLLPDNAPADGRPWTAIGFNVQPFPQAPGVPQTTVVVATWGWTAVPAQVPAAAKLQINRWNARRDSPMGIAGSPEQGSELRLLAKLDPDVATVLAGLSRRRRVG